MFRILANFLLARENWSRLDVVCRVWLRDVLPSVTDVGPDAALRRQYLGGSYTGVLVNLVVTVLIVLMQVPCSRSAYDQTVRARRSQ